jgi:hypothetical protein
MIVSDLLRAVTVIIIPIILIYGYATPLFIGCLTFALSTFGTPFYPARDSLIPHLVTEKDLPAANSAIAVSGQMSHLLGPLFAGIGITIFGLTHLFTIDAITFLFSMLMISLISSPKNGNYKYRDNYITSIKNGITYLKAQKGLSILLILTMINNIFIMGPAIIGLPVFVREVLQGDFIVLAQLETSMASGMILGSVVFWKTIKFFTPSKILIFGLIMDGLTYSLLYWSTSSFESNVILILHGIAIPLIIVSRTTIIQKIVPDEFRGRIFSLVNMAVVGTTAISTGVTGIFLEYNSAELLFLTIGLCAASTAIVPILSKSFKKQIP